MSPQKKIHTIIKIVGCGQGVQKNPILTSPYIVLAIHVPVVQKPCIHPLARHLPPRHQATEPVARPQDRRAQALRLRLREAPSAWRAECLVHLLAILPRSRTHLWRHRLHNQNR